MRLTALGFLAISFVVFWLWQNDQSLDQPSSLGPVSPSITRLLPDKPVGGQQIEASLRQWLSSEAQHIQDPRHISTQTVVRIKQKSLSLRSSDLDLMAHLALDPTLSTEGRLLAIYVIGLSESAHAKENLKEIGHSPVSSTLSNEAYANELALRARALEKLANALTP